MARLLMTSKDVQRAYMHRLEENERKRHASEIKHRKQLRQQLREAIQETVKLDGGAQALAVEYAGLVRSANARLRERPCC